MLDKPGLYGYSIIVLNVTNLNTTVNSNQGDGMKELKTISEIKILKLAENELYNKLELWTGTGPVTMYHKEKIQAQLQEISERILEIEMDQKADQPALYHENLLVEAGN